MLRSVDMVRIEGRFLVVGAMVDGGEEMYLGRRGGGD